MTEREQLAAKIRALRAKTVENGCTEDEAIAAAAKVSEMLERYNLTLDEVELRASPFEMHTERFGDEVGRPLWRVALAISELTNTRYWSARPGVYPYELTFFGFAHEVDIATYLLEICAGAMRREQSRILHGGTIARTPRTRREVRPFLEGMADRLHDRILALKPPKPTGRGLMVLHMELVDAAMPIETQTGRARPSRDFEDSYKDGLRAGDAVALNTGLTGRPATLALPGTPPNRP